MALPQDVIVALDTFDAFTEACVDELIDGQADLSSESVIYHYTNGAGLRGIVESGTFWLSDIFTMNDPSEVSHGCSHAVQLLNERAEVGPDACKLLADMFARFHRDGVAESAKYFTCSFSPNGDDLGQWRAYADDGHGYAVGFKALMLGSRFVAQGGAAHAMTFPISYSDATLVEFHRRFVDEACRLMVWCWDRRLGKALFTEFFLRLATSLSISVLQSSLFFKHEAYRSEMEYRFMAIHGDASETQAVHRRERADGPISYVEFDWRSVAPYALTSIIVGPAGDQGKVAKFAADCLKNSGCADVNVSRSTIPYRTIR